MFPILTRPAFQRTAFTCQNRVGPIKLGFHQQTFYLTDVVSVDTEDESVTVAVESTLEIAFSVEDSLDPQDVKAKAITRAKTVIVFIGNCIMFVDNLTYIDLRFLIFIYPSC